VDKVEEESCLNMIFVKVTIQTPSFSREGWDGLDTLGLYGLREQISKIDLIYMNKILLKMPFFVFFWLAKKMKTQCS